MLVRTALRLGRDGVRPETARGGLVEVAIDGSGRVAKPKTRRLPTVPGSRSNPGRDVYVDGAGAVAGKADVAIGDKALARVEVERRAGAAESAGALLLPAAAVAAQRRPAHAASAQAARPGRRKGGAASWRLIPSGHRDIQAGRAGDPMKLV